MASESEIKAAIEAIIASPPNWTIGITADPDRRKSEHGNPTRWYQWNANTETIARNVESYFIAKGMKGDVGGGITPTWVYIYM